MTQAVHNDHSIGGSLRPQCVIYYTHKGFLTIWNVLCPRKWIFLKELLHKDLHKDYGGTNILLDL